MNTDQLTQSLGLFFRSVTAKQMRENKALDSALKELKDIRNIFAKQTHYHFYSCSILIVYDANSDTGEEATRMRVKLIDFGRVFPAANQTIDENFLYGLDQLIGSLEALRKPDYEFINVIANN